MTASGVENLLGEAIELHKRGKLDAAIRAYEKVLTKFPQHPGTLNLLGLAYFQNGNAARAVPMLEQALALRPDLPGANYNLGIVLQSVKRYRDAIPQFDK